MKRIVLLSILILFITGCQSVQNTNIDTIINNSITSKVKTINVNRNGYSYYLPNGLSVKKGLSFNEVLTDQKYLYYLYVDVVSYNSNATNSFTANQNAYYSKVINNTKKGYVEINNYKNDQYLIEIMYNYAKIEVVVYESDISLTVSYAMSVLSSITYNDNVIKNYLGSNVLETIEEKFDIFEIIGRDNYLEFTDETVDDSTKNDPDYIN